MGFFLRALLKFASDNNKLDETISKVKVILSNHFIELQSSVWRGLPELTNSNGTYCRDSSRTQAWSMACILEVLHDLQYVDSNLSSCANWLSSDGPKLTSSHAAQETATISVKSYFKNFSKGSRNSLSKLQMLFSKRPKISKQNFFSIQSFRELSQTVPKSISTPAIISQNSVDERDDVANQFRVYSDIYFKLNQPLFGFKIDLSNVFYDSNCVKVYAQVYSNITYEYVPIFQKKNHDPVGILANMKRADSRKFVSKFNRNTKVFKNYISPIIYNHNKNEIDNYSNVLKSYLYRNSVEYNKTFQFKPIVPKYNVDLDEISPVEDEGTYINSPKLNHKNRRALQELQSSLLKQSSVCNKNNSENDSNIIILQPFKLNAINKQIEKEKLTLSDHKKIVRLTIFYTLSFFALAIITFFVIYLT